jgi:hypothetical protein
MQGSWETWASPEGAGLPMVVLVSWKMQGSWETWASPGGAGLPMMVVVSWEMQGSVMGDAGLIGNLGIS